jgi:hypothetical protein
MTVRGQSARATAAKQFKTTKQKTITPLPPPTKDEDEWRQWAAVGDPVVHIELRRWADALVIAPLSANTLAKAAGGLCDNLLTCAVRAWDFGRPLVVRFLFWFFEFGFARFVRCRLMRAALLFAYAKCGWDK